MALQNFVDFLPPSVKAVWLNAVDVLKFTVFGDAATKSAARTAIELDPQLIAQGTDAGAVNAAVVTLTGPVTSFVRAVGSKVSFLAVTANTGAATLNVNSTGVAAVVNQYGNALTGGELSLPTTVLWTGTQWQIIAGSISAYNARTVAEIAAAVVPVNYSYPPQNAFRYMTAAQIANVLLGLGGTTPTVNVRAALQNLFDVATQAGGYAYLPGGSYLIDQQLNAGDRMQIYGDGRDKSLLFHTGSSTITNGAMIKFDNKTAFSIRNLGFRCTQAGTSNSTIMLHTPDCVYFEVSDVSFGGSGSSAGNNKLIGCRFNQTASGFVPPRGNAAFRNILYVVEPTDSGNSVSRGISVEGHASQRINHVMFDGEGGIEHAFYEIYLLLANNCTIGGWQLRGSTQNEIRLESCSNTTIVGPQLIPPPAASVANSAGIWIDASCTDTVVINPALNYSSGVPAFSINNLGSRTSVIAPGAPGLGGPAVQGRADGSIIQTKADGQGDFYVFQRTTTDTNNGVVIRTDSAPLANAFMVINRGSGPAGQDIMRIEGGTTLFNRIANDGKLFIRGDTTVPADADFANSQISFYLDEAGNNLKVKVKYSGGTTKIGTLAVV